jgi:hypothetical protein
MRFLILFLLSTSLGWTDVNGLIQPYSHEGTYPIANGKAKIVIEKDSHRHFQYQIIHSGRGGEGTGGNPDFIKSSTFFVFPQDIDHYWIYDGQSDVVHFVFSNQA